MKMSHAGLSLHQLTLFDDLIHCNISIKTWNFIHHNAIFISMVAHTIFGSSLHLISVFLSLPLSVASCGRAGLRRHLQSHTIENNAASTSLRHCHWFIWLEHETCSLQRLWGTVLLSATVVIYSRQMNEFCPYGEDTDTLRSVKETVTWHRHQEQSSS